MIKAGKRSKIKQTRYQYQYDSNGKTIGVFIPIEEWAIISKLYKESGMEQGYKHPSKQEIKDGIVSALKEVERHKQGKTKLQSAKDFIREIRKELK